MPRYKPAKVGLLGAGMMGAGIAYAQASKGIATVLKDVSLDKAEHGKAYSQAHPGSRGQGPHDGREASRDPGPHPAHRGRADLKRQRPDHRGRVRKPRTQGQGHAEAEPCWHRGGFLPATLPPCPSPGLARPVPADAKSSSASTSSAGGQDATGGDHQGQKTDDETIARAFDYVQALGKLPIVVNDSRGFFTSRVFGTFVMEGIAMLGEGIPAAAIENAGLQCGMPVGPLAVIDETSLSLSVHVMDQTQADFAAEGKTYVPTPGEALARRMVTELGRAGRAQAGFYEYPTEPGAKKYLWPQLKPACSKSPMPSGPSPT